MKKLLIDLDTLPLDGKRIEGALDPALFELGANDPKPVSPLEYDLHAQRFESELLLQGSLSCVFEFECVRTLHPFQKTISLPEAAVAIEIDTAAELDATEALREELLLEMPNHPTCDIADEPQDCEIDPAYLAVDKQEGDEVNPAPPVGGDDRWSALDSFQSDNT